MVTGCAPCYSYKYPLHMPSLSVQIEIQTWSMLDGLGLVALQIINSQTVTTQPWNLQIIHLLQVFYMMPSHATHTKQLLNVNSTLMGTKPPVQTHLPSMFASKYTKILQGQAEIFRCWLCKCSWTRLPQLYVASVQICFASIGCSVAPPSQIYLQFCR